MKIPPPGEVSQPGAPFTTGSISPPGGVHFTTGSLIDEWATYDEWRAWYDNMACDEGVTSSDWVARSLDGPCVSV